MAVLLCISSCINYDELNVKSDSRDDIPLAEFMMGQWESKKQITDVNGSYIEDYKVEFIDEDNLAFTMKSPHDGFKDEFVYQFISESTLSVENDRAKGGKWEVRRNKENLLICIWSNENCLEFARTNSMEIWLYILILLILIVIGGKYLQRRQNKLKHS